MKTHNPTLARAGVLACLLVLAGTVGAFAQATAPGFQAPLPTDDKQVQDQLRGFDAIAVAAARHYYSSPNVKADMVTMVQGLTPSIIASIEKQRGKPLEAAERDKVVAATDKSAKAHMELLIGLNMVAALETMTREQLLALDQFYTSPIGQSILVKMPELNQRLPGIFQMFLPKFSETVEAEIKASGISAH